jgi:hypothetical protein
MGCAALSLQFEVKTKFAMTRSPSVRAGLALARESRALPRKNTVRQSRRGLPDYNFSEELRVAARRFEGFAHEITGEATNDDVFAELGDLGRD